MSRGEALRLLLAVLLLVASIVDARERREHFVPLPLAGAPLDAAPGRARDPAPPEIQGLGTWESPAAVPFARLAFPSYDPAPLRQDPTPLDASAFPAPLPALNGKVVRLEGYPLVLDSDGGRVRRFLLTRHPPGCCFGPMPVFDEWVEVTLESPVDVGGLPAGAVVAAVGRLEVGERLTEEARVESLYRLREARRAALGR